MPTQEEVDAAMALHRERIALTAALFEHKMLPAHLTEPAYREAQEILGYILRGEGGADMPQHLLNKGHALFDRANISNSASLHAMSRRCLVAAEILSGDLWL